MISHIDVEGIGPVRVQRRKGTRSIRVSLSQNGEVRLSVPYQVSLEAGIAFLREKRDWVEQHAGIPSILEDGARIGKAHTLKIGRSFSSKAKTIIGTNTVVVQLPEHMPEADRQQKLVAAARKILQKESEALLPQRLKYLAEKYGYSYVSCGVTQLKSRWGSCSSKNEIMLNAYLMQLPWELIDYVLLHELAHTKHHNHSDKFWAEVGRTMPGYRLRRRLLKKFPTSVFDTREISSRMQ